MIKNIIFDLDGTITNSYEGIINSIKYSLDKRNIEYKENELIAFIGPPLKESYTRFIGLSEEESELCIKDFREYYFKYGIKEMELYSGISEVIKKFYDQGYKIFLATSKIEESAKKILEDNNLIKYFSFISAATFDQTRVEKVDVIQYLLDNTSIDVRESFMIGDRHHDIEGAFHHDIKSIAAAYGFGSHDEYSNATFIANSPIDIYNFVKEYNR